MCGICGVHDYRFGRPVDPAALRKMVGTLVHRGPDDEGVLASAGVGLAMRRLSIIDIAGGHQPIANEDGTIHVVFNGEIYNYQELRDDLTRRGHVFRTRSDTEVIVHLYEEYGSAGVSQLDGMFAFGLFDARTMPGAASEDASAAPGRLVLARDRLGKKPLYYADVDGRLVFGSELKTLLQDPGVGKSLDLEALHHYLSLLMVPAPYTIFERIRKLPPGCVLECDERGPRVSRYWNFLDHVGAADVPAAEAVSRVRELLLDAVRKRLMSEVPLGAFLSGGLDSSVVVGLMSRLLDEPVKTFSIGFEGPATHDELPYARAVARHFATDHHEFVASPAIVDLIQEVVAFADEPFAISSAIPTLLLARAAGRDVRVVLTGDGGDEAFGGYESYLYEQWAAAWRMLPALVNGACRGAASILPGRVDRPLGRWRTRLERFTANARRSDAERRLGWASGFSEPEKQRIYLHALRNGCGTAAFLDRQVPAAGNSDAISRANSMDVMVWLPDEMLTKVDRMTMAASVEARCPLLDWKLVEYLAGLSFRVKVPGWRSRDLKSLLRRAASDLLPPELLARRKQGFNVPLDAWFRGEARGFLETVLSPSRVRRRGLFDPQAVDALVGRHHHGDVNASNRLYALLVFEVWSEKYL